MVAVLNAAALALRPFTIVRSRGVIFYRSDQIAADENYGGAYGHCVVSDQASSVGITAVPAPIPNQDSDLWFVYQSMFGRIVSPTAVGVLEIGRQIEYDSKAMRKVEDGQDMVIVLSTDATSPSLVIIDSGRLLIKLH